MKRNLGYERGFNVSSNKALSRKRLEKIMIDIWNEYDRRLTAKVSFEDGSSTRNETAKNFLRREIYVLGMYLLDEPPITWRIEDFVDGWRDTKTTRPRSLANVFHALLMCVYRSDSRISRQERSLMAKELEYAWRHEVPPSLLCGFLYQSTDRKKIGERLAEDFREPAFR
jgi:hypothetical protein